MFLVSEIYSLTMFLLGIWWEFSFIFGLHFMETISMLKIAEWRTIGPIIL